MLKQIIAHRGASKHAKENTLQAFEKALQFGVDGIELDVRNTKDSQLVVYHNKRIGGKLVGQLLFVKLKSLALKRGFVISTLAECLEAVKAKTQVYIEIKAQGYELQTLEVALKYLTTKDFAILSFYGQSLLKIKENYPEVKVGLLLGAAPVHWLQNLKFLFNRKNILSKIDFTSIDSKLWMLGLDKLVPKEHKVSVWTGAFRADSNFLLKILLRNSRFGSIITNKPDSALRIRQEINA